MRLIACHFILVLAALAAAPLPDNLPKPNGLPDLACESNWGTVKQDGKKLAIGGHHYWTAAGEIREDGKVVLVWQTTSDGQFAPGLYVVERAGPDVRLVGKWGYSGVVEWDEDGELVGTLSADVTYAKGK